MNSLLIHGCYDSNTLDTLKKLGITEYSFDLRARSSNLVVFKDLKVLIKSLSLEKVFLTFENDTKETVLSFLDLLRDRPITFKLIFRDVRPVEFYQDLAVPFLWMFNPAGDWKSILNLPNLKGILLPISFQDQFQRLPDLWDVIDRRNLNVYLHGNTFQEVMNLNLTKEINICLDLTAEVETSYRSVDQDKLKRMKIWRKLNENFAGQ
jgi:hypothetical protein